MPLIEILKKIWINYISSGLNITDDQAIQRLDNKYLEIRKITFLNIVSLLGVILGFVYLALGLIKALGDTVFFSSSVLGVMLFNIVLLRITKKPQISAFFMIIAVSSVLSTQIILNRFDFIMLLGLLLFVSVSFYITSKEIAVFSSIAILTVSIGLVLIFGNEFYQSIFRTYGIQLALIFIFAILISFAHQTIEDKNQNQMAESKKELANSFNQMVEEIEQRRKLESKLQKSLDESASSNSQLERTQKAMLNVMEDLEHEKNAILKKQAEDESILGSIGEGLIVTDVNGRIILVNKAFEDILGYDPVDMIGKEYGKAFPIFLEDGRGLDLTESLLFKTIKERKVYINEVRLFQTKEGNKIPVKITITPIMLDGNVTGAVEAFRDVTKELEIDRAKTEFVSLASHQLKTPLSAINWYIELLLSEDSGKLNKDQKDLVSEIQIGAKRMNDLINALLNVSRIDMGTFAVDPEPTDIIELCDSVLHELKKQIKDKEMVINTMYQKGLNKFNVDPKLMRIVLQNLLTNAIKYTPTKGKIDIEIKSDGKNMIFNISDNGYGIPKNQQNKIFSKLFRADNVLTKETDGTGLGLYIVKSIIESSNGKIWFESEENKGTKFFITIPIEGMQKKEGTKALV